MEFDELEVLRIQVQQLLQRVAELENQNTRHIAMIQILLKRLDDKE